MKRLIVAATLIISGNAFSNVDDDFQNRQYQQEMLQQQREQNSLLKNQNDLIQAQKEARDQASRKEHFGF